VSEERPEPRKDFVRIVERALKRPLVREEMKAVEHLDEFVVKTAVSDLTPDEMVAMLNDVCGFDSPVRLLTDLAKSPSSFQQARVKLISFYEGDSRRCLERFDFDSALEQFSQWFLQLLRADPPSPGLQVLKFGLFESGGGCRLYAAGTKTYDDKHPKWVDSNDWWNQSHVMPEGFLKSIWSELKQNRPRWVAWQAITIVVVQAFFAKHAREFQKLSGLGRIHVASGFDEGDLYALRTAVSPDA
jgi:hypothetical protein